MRRATTTSLAKYSALRVSGPPSSESTYLIPSTARDLARMVPEPVRYGYIMASASRVLYTGITSDLRRRVDQHKTGVVPGFTRAYRVTRLVHFEWTDHVRAAIGREREIKSWRRDRKIRLVESHNAGWLDLALDWYPDLRDQGPSLRSG